MIRKLIEKAKYFNSLASKRDRTVFLGIIVMMVLAAGLETISIGAVFPLVSILADQTAQAGNDLFSPIINFGRETFGHRFLIVAALFVLFIFLAKNICLYFLSIVQNNFIFQKQQHVQIELYKRYLRAPYIQHLDFNSAELIRNVAIEVPNLFNYMFRMIFAIAVDVIMVIAITGFVFMVAPSLTFGLFFIFGLSGYVFHKILKNKIAVCGSWRQEALSQTINWVNQGLGGIREIKVLEREKNFINGFEKAVSPLAVAESKVAVLVQIPKLYFEMLSIAVVMILIVALSMLNPSNANIMPLIAMYSVSGMRMGPAFNRLVGNITSIKYYQFSLDVVMAEFARLKKKDDVHELDLSDVHTTTGLSLSRVNFRYPSKKKNVLDQISLSVGPHEVIGIVGESGAGKTTLINIILGLITPTSGSVFIDGQRIGDKKTGKDYLVGYVPQEIYLSDDTIRKNIAYGLPEHQIDEEKVREAVKLAQLDDFISSSPEGLQTIVGERGMRISGGQKQRIGIARALYADPKLLIFDEPTSALDAQTEKELVAAIEEISHNKMVVIVTHRKGLLVLCQRIYKMLDGKLTEMQKNIPDAVDEDSSKIARA
jgi:ABC-type multidrug transport system fused ATPase/permease subunit